MIRRPRLPIGPRPAVLLLGLLPLAGLPAAPAAGDDPFSIHTLESDGRTVAAELADFDGDGRQDLLQVSFFGSPPHEQRKLRVYLQRSGRVPFGLPAKPDIEVELPADAAYYDLGDVRGDAGRELLLVGSGRIYVGVVSTEPVPRLAFETLPVPDNATITAAPDERGLDRSRIVLTELGAAPVLLAPGLGEAILLDADGALRARLAVGGRANYFIQPPGPMLSESDIQLFYDVTRIFVGDVDRDGRADVVSSSRHELRTFQQREDGSFPHRPDRRIWLELVDEADHIRGSGSVRTDIVDIDGDGLLDLLITHSEGGIMATESRSAIHWNSGGGWNLAEPDIVLPVDGGLSADQLLDVDRDGALELLQIKVPLSLLEIVEILLTQSVDAHLRLFPLVKGGPKTPEALIDRKLGVDVDFAAGRPAGFIATMDHDLNNDGHLDVLGSGDGSELQVYLGGSPPRYRKDETQSMDTAGRIRPGDLDGDGLVDFVLYNPRDPKARVTLLINRGTLPRTRRPTQLRPASD